MNLRLSSLETSQQPKLFESTHQIYKYLNRKFQHSISATAILALGSIQLVCAGIGLCILLWSVMSKNILLLIAPANILSSLSTQYSSILGNTKFQRGAVPSLTGRRTSQVVLILGRASMEDPLPLKRWKTLRHSFVFFSFFCHWLGFISQVMDSPC